MITQTEYDDEINAIAEGIKARVREFGEDVNDVVHEEIDGHAWVIYTARAYQVLPLANTDPFTAASDLGVVPDSVSVLAFLAMEADVYDALDGWTGPDDDDEERDEL